jgi:hypothetical protein
MHTDPLRPGTKANAWNRKNWRFYGLALGVLCLLGGQYAVKLAWRIPAASRRSILTVTTGAQKQKSIHVRRMVLRVPVRGLT